MILTFALLIGAAAFCGEILFNCILKQRIFCAASGNSLVKAVLYPCAIASLALWGTDYLFSQTDIEIITASTMVENQASANVLRKNGFTLVVHAVGEDWGYPEPTIADKWIR